MSFRAPRFSYKHAFRDAGIGAMAFLTGSADPDKPVINALDDRSTANFALSSAGLLQLYADLGGDFATSGLNGFSRIILPAGTHNHSTNNKVRTDDNAGFTSVAQFSSQRGSPTAGELFHTELNSAPTFERYIQWHVGAGTKAWESGELIITNVQTFTQGPDLANSIDEIRENFTRLVQPSGISTTIQNGAPRRYMELEYRDLQGQDLIDMEAFIDWVGMSLPFWVDPVSFAADPDTDDPPIWMKFDQPPRISNEVDVPAGGIARKRFRLFIIEHLG